MLSGQAWKHVAKDVVGFKRHIRHKVEGKCGKAVEL